MKLHKIVEVREGQWTDSFNKFPYDEVQDQSLSLIFEEESECYPPPPTHTHTQTDMVLQHVCINLILFIAAKKFVRLTSIDLICDHPDNYDQWIEGVSSSCTHSLFVCVDCLSLSCYS